MITIGRIPTCVRSFFRLQRRHFPKRAWPHFWGLVTAMAMGTEHTIERLNALLRGHGHRTNDGEFLWRSHWDEVGVLQGLALRLLNRVWRSGEPIYFILDDTQTLKRAKKMEAVGKLYHHATGTYGTGHTILKACLYCRGVTIPWGSWLYVKKEHAGKLQVPFATLTELASQAVRGLPLPPKMKVIVLFDAYYLCSKVAAAVEAKGWHYIGGGQVQPPLQRRRPLASAEQLRAKRPAPLGPVDEDHRAAQDGRLPRRSSNRIDEEAWSGPSGLLASARRQETHRFGHQ